MIRRLTKKDENSFLDLLGLDEQKLFHQIIKRSGICYVKDDGNIDAILLIEKNENRRFIRIVDKGHNLYHLFRVLFWNHNVELFWEIENGSIFERLTRKFKFFPIEKKEKTTIYCRKPYKEEKNGRNHNRKYYHSNSRSDRR